MCGVQKFDKVVLPLVILEAKEVNAIPMRSHPWTGRPRQWHVTRGGHTVEKELRRGG